MIEYPNVQKIDEYLDINKGNNWKKVSSCIEAQSKIYSYRVDSVHEQTHKILQNLGFQEDEN